MNGLKSRMVRGGQIFMESVRWLVGLPWRPSRVRYKSVNNVFLVFFSVKIEYS